MFIYLRQIAIVTFHGRYISFHKKQLPHIVPIIPFFFLCFLQISLAVIDSLSFSLTDSLSISSVFYVTILLYIPFLSCEDMFSHCLFLISVNLCAWMREIKREEREKQREINSLSLSLSHSCTNINTHPYLLSFIRYV